MLKETALSRKFVDAAIDNIGTGLVDILRMRVAASRGSNIPLGDDDCDVNGSILDLDRSLR
jgi:hypothetical protein